MCLLAATLVASASPLGAISASTAPAGFVRTTVAAAAAPGRHAASLLGMPLLPPAVYSGRIDTVSATSGSATIRLQPGTGARLNSFDAGQPHAVFVTSGDFSGFIFKVIGRDRHSVTVDSLGFDLSTILAPGDGFEVRPLHTFKTLFGVDSASVPFMASPDAALADQLMICRDGVWRSYWFTGSAWRRTGAGGDAGDDVILPQDGIVVYRRDTTPLPIRFVGEAPATDAVISVPAGAISTVANPFPMDATIGEFGFETVSGWRCSIQSDEADQVRVCAGNSWRTLWHDGAGWRSSGGTGAEETIPAATAMMIVRKPSDAANTFAVISRPYDL